MIKIISVNIKRFRSIIDMSLSVSTDNNMISICGQNNVGKTNTLRAINLFFHPEKYDKKSDMPEIKKATGGQSIYSIITLSFYDNTKDIYYELSRDIKNYLNEKNSLNGKSYNKIGRRRVNKKDMDKDEINTVLRSIEFVYIESINVLIPELINKLTEDMISVQYDKARFTKSKKELKESYEKYVEGLNELLSNFASDISSTFKRFDQEWSVRFLVPKNSDTVRDLLSGDIKLTLDDNGSTGIVEKGAGLQRLSTILLTYEMLLRMNKRKSLIVCLDEPDIYLHEGLQKKLKKFFEEKSEKIQLFYTTHSRVFINIYNMKNVFYLESKQYEQFSARKNKKINVTETYCNDINNEEGYYKICRHLGIEKIEHDILEKNNILVEGKCDKKYIEELAKFFGFNVPNIVAINGVDNAIKYLEFYDSYYKNSSNGMHPRIKVVFDNDYAGRNTYKKIEKKAFKNIKVQCVILGNYLNNSNIDLEHNTTNNEIEDFIYPELLCYLINELLKKKGMDGLDAKKIESIIKTKAFASKGILELCEHEKNSNNPDLGADISFTSSSEGTNQFKEGLAGIFVIEANKKILSLIDKCDKKYPEVREQLKKLLCFDTFD